MVVLINDTQKTRGVAEEVKNWGCFLSELFLKSSFESFRHPTIPGFIGYYRKSGFAIVIGDPVCPMEYTEILTDAFQKTMKEQKLDVIYFGVSESFTKWAYPDLCPVKIQVVEELIFDPFDDALEGPKASKLRNKILFAKKHGLAVKEYYVKNSETEKALQKVARDWEKSRNGPQLYLEDIGLFDLTEGSRWFYIRNKERFFGFALLKQMDAKDGWLLKHHIVLHEAPKGTTELLLIEILETLRKENCHYLTYGIIPVADVSDIQGLGSFSKGTIRLFFKFIKWFFNLNHRKSFWDKFQPFTKPVYILFSSKRFSLSHIYALMSILKIKF